MVKKIKIRVLRANAMELLVYIIFIEIKHNEKFCELGVTKFLEGYYLMLITECSSVGTIGSCFFLLICK